MMWFNMLFDVIQRHPIATIGAALSGIGLSFTGLKPAIQLIALILSIIAAALTAWLKWEQIWSTRSETKWQKRKRQDAVEEMREGLNEEENELLDDIIEP